MPGRITGAIPRRPKKAKQVTGNKPKLSKLAELKKVNKQIDQQRRLDDKRFTKMDKLFTKSRKLKEQLGID
jgi:hypothetical protein